MKLSRAFQYAVHGCAELARAADDRPQASHEIARARGIPERFLLKVFKPLATARVLQSMKGPNGGYRLARPPSKITMLEIFEAIEGPLTTAPSDFQARDGQDTQRQLDNICETSNTRFRIQLSKVSLADGAPAPKAKQKAKAGAR